MSVSLEQKRLQLPTEFSDVVVGLTNPGWQTVPEPWSSGCEAPIAEPCVGPWNAARVDVGHVAYSSLASLALAALN